MKKPRTRTLVLVTATALVLGTLGTAGTVAYLTFVQAPDHAPADACSGGREDGQPPTVVAAGASMVQGALGADWVGALRDDPALSGYDLVNAGVNGSTSADLLDRVETDVVACDPEAVLILVGANDVRGEIPPDEYGQNIGAVVERVQTDTHARVALLSLPPLGEDLDDGYNEVLEEYNTVLAETAEAADVDYLPLYERMADHLASGDVDRPAYDFSFVTGFRAAFEHRVLRRSWDEVADRQGMELFVDHLHLSDRGGEMVLDEVRPWLSNGEPPGEPSANISGG